MSDLGQLLYESWLEALSQRSCSVDPWGTLPDEDKVDWNLAAQIFMRKMTGECDKEVAA